ncbi:MAG TPA: hypothetical protein VFK02_16805 [Kofleriaceae bacterium]|nr:hypothetical protein [Kofleriaceae bacterium]
MAENKKSSGNQDPRQRSQGNTNKQKQGGTERTAGSPGRSQETSDPNKDHVAPGMNPHRDRQSQGSPNRMAPDPGRMAPDKDRINDDLDLDLDDEDDRATQRTSRPGGRDPDDQE